MHQRLQETICKYDFVKALTINHKKPFLHRRKIAFIVYPFHKFSLFISLSLVLYICRENVCYLAELLCCLFLFSFGLDIFMRNDITINR